MKYIGESCRNLNKRLYIFKGDILQNNTLYALVIHCNISDSKVKNMFLMKRDRNLLR